MNIMQSEPVIIVNNVTKIYPKKPQLMKKRDDSFVSFLSKTILKTGQGEKEFHALSEVSFSVHAGERVGIVGYNGAGKSTLLRVITGITSPTSGEVTIHGKYGELFALNAGFNVDLSGRKNIYLISAIKGFSKGQTDLLVDDIIEFSELGDFIDQPVKVYSSGMRGRLGFSILINLLPDIIFIDEALATGDNKFREKCEEKLNEMVQQEKTLVIVSHSNSTLEAMCSRLIWMDRGKILMDGDTKEILEAYENDKIAKKQARK